MKILVLSRLYWPDTVAVAQHLGDYTFALAEAGHSVTVLTSTHAYEDPKITWAEQETHQGVEIIRIDHQAADKSSRLKRILDFAWFNLLIFWKALTIKGKYEVILGLTNPPLLSLFGVIIARLRGSKFCYWTMDLQPELAIEAGYIKARSLTALGLTWMGNLIFRQSNAIIALDTYMRDHIVRRGGRPDRIAVLPPWPVMAQVYEGARMDNTFRLQQGFGDKIVIMYSGNHAVVHPLDTLLAAALHLRDDPRFLFVFIGGGVRKQDVTQFKAQHHLDNILQLPYQPRDVIHLSLGSADLQVVIMGDGHVGYTHPNKIYGAMYIGKPILYIGPRPSHIDDILTVCPGNISVQHGDGIALRDALLEFATAHESVWTEIGRQNRIYAHRNFEPQNLIQQHRRVIERL
ncbi:MAG: glycosyltransferase family 4 protein [Bacteroidia bacterium]|nr:glycosyltransferase family 4 protein [Bacteroidia bacterium]